MMRGGKAYEDIAGRLEAIVTVVRCYAVSPAPACSRDQACKSTPRGHAEKSATMSNRVMVSIAYVEFFETFGPMVYADYLQAKQLGRGYCAVMRGRPEGYGAPNPDVECQDMYISLVDGYHSAYHVVFQLDRLSLYDLCPFERQHVSLICPIARSIIVALGYLSLSSGNCGHC